MVDDFIWRDVTFTNDESLSCHVHSITDDFMSTKQSAYTNKYKLIEVCKLLDVPIDLIEMPNGGWLPEEINNQQRAFERGRRIFNVISDAICDLIS